MDDLPFLSHLLKNISPSALGLITRQALRLKDDQVLIAELIAGLISLVAQGTTPAAAPILIRVPDHTMLGQWAQLYGDAIARPAFREWASGHNLELASLVFRGADLQASVLEGTVKTPYTFTLDNNVGWWQVANPILEVVQIIDTINAGLPFMENPAEHHSREMPLDLVLPFYGYPIPKNHLQAQVILEEIHTLDTLPGVDESGRLKSALRKRLTEEQRDYLQLADALQALLGAETNGGLPFDWLGLYLQRLSLDSDSMLSSTLKYAARLLKAVTGGEEFLSLNPASPGAVPRHYYAVEQKAVVAVIGSHVFNTSPVDRSHDTPLNQQWDELERLAKLAHTDILPDASLSLAALMTVYRLPRPASAEEAQALVLQLRATTAATFPYVTSMAYSVTAVSKHRRHITVLNERHTLQAALRSITLDTQLESTLDTTFDLVPDSPFAPLIAKGAQLLADLRREPVFQRISGAHQFNPAREYVLTVDGDLSGYALDDTPKVLTRADTPLTRLTSMADPLRELARQSGGRISTDGQVSVRQLLNLYQVKLPTTRDEAHVTARLLAIAILKPPRHGNYWRALQVMPLLAAQRQQVLQAVAAFLPSQDVTLFDFLSEAIIGERTREQVRAEADRLLLQLASAQAQALAARLSETVGWYGEHASATNTRASRNALLFAALILSLDPGAGARRATVAGYDLTDSYNWGLPFAEVRNVVEAMVRRKVSRPNAAPMAAHLLLAGVAPEFLVRDIRGEVSYMSSHTWVHFKQYVDLIEAETPGASRAMSFTDFMALIYFVTPARRVRRGTAPITDWAVANGVLPPHSAARSTADKNRAIAALNEQLNRLQVSTEQLEAPDASRYDMAVQDLQRVFPGNLHLEQLIIQWRPAPGAPAATGPVSGIASTTAVSMAQLHMAGLLTTDAAHWRSTLKELDFAGMAQRFNELSALHTAFAVTFEQRYGDVRTALMQSIVYWMSQLTLLSREAMEYGDLQFYRLRQPQPGASVGRYGVLVLSQYFGDRHFYEFFPRQLKVARLPGLAYQAFATAADAANPKGRELPIDWSAYHLGTNPVEQQHATVSAERFAHLPAVYGPRPAVPNTFSSPRSQGIAATIIDKHLLAGIDQARQAAGRPLALSDALGGHDPASAFLRAMMPPPMK
ncbi:hypothetical protein RGV33_14710 [Pseudomonas sp. Bout1]|uniref:hypothetical protein n=1 Tax=Pseudomonas sp. Bout1 TaxID=3048600 RepID=UPI002AB34C47|nr:hypothetical protein [Pseudomonas sp. Bout1]MDY7532917.1 hypothetical protein [Pseudomonas sp. Bout1]MEB0187133.1 hypothetical protein [Pseudomonas sp. Bout1]